MVLQNLAYTAILLGVLVFVHEFGHFIVAKSLGVKVLRFSIGFGPRVVGFTRGETEYRIAWLPLGGYVKMAGEQPGEELPPEEAKRGFLAQPPWKRALIVFAGPFFNLAFPILVFFFVSLGTHQAISTRVGSVEPGLPAAQAHLRPGDRIVAVDGAAVKTFDELRDALQPAFSRETTLSVEREGKTFQTTLVPTKNLESNPIETVPRGMIGITPVTHAAVVGVPPGSAAEKAGLKNFDRVLSVDGKPVKSEEAFIRAIEAAGAQVQLTVARERPLDVPGASVTAPSVVTLTVPKQVGEGYAGIGAQSAELYVARVLPDSAAARAGIAPGDKITSVNGKALESTLNLSIALNNLGAKPFTLTWEHQGQPRQAQVTQQSLTQKDEFGTDATQLDLGARFHQPSEAEIGEAEMIPVTLGVGAALARSFQIVPEITGKMVKVIAYLFTGRVPFKSVGGPVMIYQMASKTAQAGLDPFLNLMALISINLGLMNLLPIPVLDGFHLLAALWEGIRRRPIPVRAREIANMVGLAMLVVLMVLVFKNDLTR
jgi:regulator of sigma E protease